MTLGVIIVGGSSSGYLFGSPKFATPVLPGGMFCSSLPTIRMIVAGPVLYNTNGLL